LKREIEAPKNEICKPKLVKKMRKRLLGGEDNTS